MKIWSRQLKVTWEAHAGRWRVKPVVQRIQYVNWLTHDSGRHLHQSQVSCKMQDAFVLLKHMTFCILLTHTIYTLITHRYGKELIERKTLRNVSTTHPPYYGKSYSFLERNLCSLFSFPLPLLYSLRGDMYPNTTHTHLECWEYFWSFGKHWKMPRMVDAIWSLLRDPES